MFKIHRFDLLVSMYIFCIVAAELMGAKTFHLFTVGGFNLNASVAIFLLPLIYTINDVITEVYGKERTRSVIRSGLVVIFLILLFSLLVTHLPPSTRFAGSEAAYDDIFSKSARISAASLIAFALAEFLDVYVFSKIREKLGKKALWLRNNTSNFAAQLLDTVVFITLAFYAFSEPLADNVSFILGLVLPYWLLKCSISILETPFVYAGVRWLKADNDSEIKK